MIEKVKRRKIAVISCTVVILVGVFIFTTLSNINDVQNSYTMVTSDVYSIEQSIKTRNTLLLESKELLNKYSEVKDEFTKFETENKKSKTMINFANNTKELNNIIKGIIDAKGITDEIIKIYTINNEMKKDEELSEKMDEIIAIDYGIEYMIKDFNDNSSVEFNSSINKPVIKLMSGAYNIVNLYKIK